MPRSRLPDRLAARCRWISGAVRMHRDDPGDVPLIRPARAGDLPAVLGVYRACCHEDAEYLPFLNPDVPDELVEWFRLKPLAVALVACAHDGAIVGVAGLRNAPPPGSLLPGTLWMGACRLAVAPAYRGG